MPENVVVKICINAWLTESVHNNRHMLHLVSDKIQRKVFSLKHNHFVPLHGNKKEKHPLGK